MKPGRPRHPVLRADVADTRRSSRQECGHVNRPGARFCSGCGVARALPAMRNRIGAERQVLRGARRVRFTRCAGRGRRTLPRCWHERSSRGEGSMTYTRRSPRPSSPSSTAARTCAPRSSPRARGARHSRGWAKTSRRWRACAAPSSWPSRPTRSPIPTTGSCCSAPTGMTTTTTRGCSPASGPVETEEERERAKHRSHDHAESEDVEHGPFV